MSRAEVRPVRMWAIDYGRGNIDPWSVRRTRKDAIKAYVGEEPGMYNWRYWHSKGCRAIRVTVTPEATP